MTVKGRLLSKRRDDEGRGNALPLIPPVAVPGPTVRRLAAAAFLGLLCVAGNVTADTDWWSQGKAWLGDIGEQFTEAGGLTTKEISAGLQEALRVATERVVQQLGKLDGFNADPRIHIPLPESLASVKSTLGRIGMSSILDDLELRLNRAAEAATSKAKPLFWAAIREMTLEDAKGIYNGPDDAATRYFQRKMSPQLAREMQPVVDRALEEVGAISTYDRIMGRYRALPFVPDVKADLTEYVVGRGMDGIFLYVAREEAAIRQDPAKRTTELLRRVFGQTR